MAPPTERGEGWTLPEWAAAVLAIDPRGSGGLLLRAPAGPETDRWLEIAREVLAPRPWRTVSPSFDPDQLNDTLDLARTLRTSRLHRTPGLVQQVSDGVLEIRWPALLDVVQADGLARAALRVGVAATQPSSERGDDGDGVPALLADRLALHVPVPPRWSPSATTLELAKAVRAARATRTVPRTPKATATAVLSVADRLGVTAPRTVAASLRTARLLAALRGSEVVEDEDVVRALALVVVPRSGSAPARPRDPPGDPRGNPDSGDPEASQDEERERSDERQGEASPRPTDVERLVAAAESWIEPETLARARAGGRSRRDGAGGARSGVASGAGPGGRGRTVRARPGRPGRGRTLHLLETLRAAAPRQAARGGDGGGTRIEVRPSDLRIRIRERRDPCTVVFAVDASGSQAVARLAEVKGAVELLLSDSYRRRDHVALIAFRQARAELLLPPTRSLTRARRATAALPGGGGTPLAHGLVEAARVARAESRLGRRPMIVVLTDGRPNVPLVEERAGRDAAREDALSVARAIETEGWPTMIVDSARRPRPFTDELGRALGATVVRLRGRGPETIRDAVSTIRAEAAPIRSPLGATRS